MKRSVFFLCVLQLCAALSVNMLLVMLTGLVYGNDGSVSFLMIAMVLPSLLFANVIGKTIDKLTPVKFLSAGIFFEISMIGAMVISEAYLYNYMIYAFAFVAYTIDIFIRLYLQSVIVYIGNKKSFLRMNSLLDGVENFGVILGLICGGFLIEYAATSYAFIAVGASFFMTLISVLFLDIPQMKMEGTDTPQAVSILKNNRDGNYDEVKKICYAACIFSFAIALVNVRQISFVITQYNTGEFGYSLTESIWIAGVILSCFIILLFGQKIHPHKIWGFGYISAGMILLLMVISTSFSAALFLFFLIGAANGIISISVTTLIQQLADRNSIGKFLGMKTMYQRVFTIIAMIFGGVLDPMVSSQRLYGLAAVIFMLGGGRHPLLLEGQEINIFLNMGGFLFRVL